ncbi:MAG: 4-alpha-glucanotransferase [Pseudoflavonifractor sp.]|nr:4-alpha-glucanotransferase [Alloprevotella sp.]MCM1116900.1 4-alpha-glucanotransferase [Pseudoflavonifractor sp.]
MKLSFFIEYHTQWGENIAIRFSRPLLGMEAGAPLSMPLKPIPGTSLWHIEIACADLRQAQGNEYGYELIGGDGTVVRKEWHPHVIPAADPSTASLALCDAWSDRPADLPYLSTLFTKSVCRRPDRYITAPKLPTPGTVTIEATAPIVPTDCTLAIAGSIPALGLWDPTKALRLSDANYPTWTATFTIPEDIDSFEYKFLIVNSGDGSVKSWEPRSNRRFDMPSPSSSAETVIISGLNVPAPMPLWRGAGVAIPVFSLRSVDDFGVGDFADIRKMADWTAMTGQRIIQLLPVNDTHMTGKWTDSYPYNSISSFALHPMYLRPTDAGTLADPDRMVYYDQERKHLQALPALDYEAAFKLKMDYMAELFAQDGPETILSAPFTEFVEKNAHWLTPYAAFCILRDRFGTPDMTQWGEYSSYNPERIAALIDANIGEIQFVYFLQYHLDLQLRDARDYAHSRGVALKGDIPIGISRTSVDAWLHPELFHLDASAGAPPDDFAVNGQNWGFPTYNWDAMARDGYQWWKDRFRNMARYFDAYRIDHVLGFFRIWQIPIDQLHGLLGVFSPALPFSEEELRQSYDFGLNAPVNCRPYIADWTLPDFFGNRVDEVKERFLIPIGAGRYELRPEYSTQKAIAAWAETIPSGHPDHDLVEPLMGLIDQVLFLPDPYQKGLWHPRIAAQYTYSYRALNDYERYQFDKLYNDFFYRRNDAFWRERAMQKLPPIIEATHMLTCAEDLGMIPACVPSVMDDLRILSLEIQRMPKDTGRQFGDPATYPYLSVCATSTHDMPGIRGWWESNHAMAQSFFNNMLHQSGDAPLHAEPWICSMIVDSHLHAISMLCILPLQDYLSIDGDLRRDNPADEVINEPSNPRHYWRYRMHLTLEQLTEAHEFNSRLASMIATSGR